MSHTLLLTTFCFCLFIATLAGDNFRFDRNISCIQQDKKGICKGWNQTTILYRYSDYIFYCFPADLYVLTSSKPLKMSELKIDDQIFGLNLQTGKNQFTKVTSWLHHDPTSLLQYRQISIQNQQWKFLSSKNHNIAFASDQQADFKFLKDLQSGDTLISITENGQDLRVNGTQQKVEKQGLYSPFTETGTFYIFPDSFSLEQYQKSPSTYPMILVHSLSQISNPVQNFKTASNYMSTVGALFNHYQPTDDQEYVNPMLSQFSFIFGSDWNNQGGQKIAHRYSSYSSTRQRQQQERKRKTMAVLAIQDMLSNTIR